MTYEDRKKPKTDNGDATDDHSQLPAEIASQCDTLALKVKSLEVAYEAVERHLRAGESVAVQNMWYVAIRTADEGLSLAIQIWKTIPDGTPLRRHVLQHIEQQLNRKPGTLDEYISRQDRHTRRLESIAEAERVQRQLQQTPNAPTSWQHNVEAPSLLAAALRVTATTVVGALVGAPIGAILVQENVWKEVVKAGVAAFVGSVTAEAIAPAARRLESPQSSQDGITEQRSPSPPKARPNPLSILEDVPVKPLSYPDLEELKPGPYVPITPPPPPSPIEPKDPGFGPRGI